MATARKTPESGENKGKEIEEFIPKYSDDELLSVQSFEDALELAAQYYGQENLVRADETIGNGFRLLTNKSVLEDTPLLILGWRFNPGDYGEFVTMMIVAKDGRKFIVNDGSTGICQQLAAYTNATGRHGGMLVANGFTRSDYEVEVPDSKTGEMVKTSATTYYINTSA